MNILITGIHGFVGSNFVAELKRQHSVYGLDIVLPEKDGVIKTYTWNELEQIPSVDIIIHLAGKAHDTKNQTEAKTYFEINTRLTQKIYDYFLKSPAKKFVFFSSVKAVANSVPGDILTEEVVPYPVGPYGESKIAAENYIRANYPKDFSKNVYILRPCMIHGSGNKGNLNLLYNIVSKGIPWPLGAFNNRRSYTSIDNLTFVINQVMANDIESGVYNMSDDEPLSTNELIELICQTTGKPVRIWKWNRLLMERCSSLGTTLHLPLNNERLQKLTESYVVSNNKLKIALGIDKMPMSAKEGMIKTLNSFK